MIETVLPFLLCLASLSLGGLWIKTRFFGAGIGRADGEPSLMWDRMTFRRKAITPWTGRAARWQAAAAVIGPPIGTTWENLVVAISVGTALQASQLRRKTPGSPRSER